MEAAIVYSRDHLEKKLKHKRKVVIAFISGTALRAAFNCISRTGRDLCRPSNSILTGATKLPAYQPAPCVAKGAVRSNPHIYDWLHESIELAGQARSGAI